MGLDAYCTVGVRFLIIFLTGSCAILSPHLSLSAVLLRLCLVTSRSAVFRSVCLQDANPDHGFFILSRSAIVAMVHASGRNSGRTSSQVTGHEIGAPARARGHQAAMQVAPRPFRR